MAKLMVAESFIHKDVRYNAGTILTVSNDDLKAEIAKGFHPNPPGKDKKTDPRKNGRYLSGLMTHCTPADDATAAFISKETGQEVAVADDGEEDADTLMADIASLRSEFDAMGAAFDNRWGVPRLRNELIKAKKERGL
jgi:hypothetical protein